MPWLKVSDTAMQNSIVRRALDLPHANAEYVYTLFGVMLGCAVEAAALKADYVIERNSIAAKVGLDRCDQIIQDAITCGYITHEVQLKNGIRAYKLVEDEDLFHMRLKSEIDWENRRRNDTRSKSLIVPIRVRDGDACRWCGRVVYWGDQKSARGGTYDHLHPTQPAEKASDMVVACRSCNSARKDNTEWGGKLLPPPSKPSDGRKTVEFLAENDVIVALSPESEKPTVPAAQFLQSGLAAGEPEGSKNPQGEDGVVCAITEEASSVRSRQTENSTTVDVPESVSSGARCKRRRKRRRIRQKDPAAPVSPIGMSQHSELLRIPPNPQGDGYGCAGSGRDGTATKNITSSSRKRRRGKRKGKVSNACSTV